ncbi:hypothetical protein [Methylomicrobium sp. Wu6]|uniref:hypothetical protein n=1 Tax=Methylomicrobium sp. Wu6 TaxID=3107928 RepID=UPI002DD6646C|nr:hypothetical protein [Methylomicrobium sp. Wu6]MEC4747106.1 hypothetical protein [Methylomicrobium sp. Wu6]
MHRSTTHTKNGFLEMLNIFDCVKSSLIVAGHYSVGPDLNETSIPGLAESLSFEAGADLVRRAHRLSKNCRLVLWINDLAINQEGRDAFKQNYRLPDHYAEIVRRNYLKDQDICVMYKSSLRNQASTELHAIYKKMPYLFDQVEAADTRLIRCVDTAPCSEEREADRVAYVIQGPYKEPLVVKDGPHPNYNLTLATLFKELNKRFSPGMIVTVFNETDEYRLNLGMHVAKTLFNMSTPMMNVYCDHEELSAYNFASVPLKYRR